MIVNNILIIFQILQVIRLNELYSRGLENLTDEELLELYDMQDE